MSCILPIMPPLCTYNHPAHLLSCSLSVALGMLVYGERHTAGPLGSSTSGACHKHSITVLQQTDTSTTQGLSVALALHAVCAVFLCVLLLFYNIKVFEYVFINFTQKSKRVVCLNEDFRVRKAKTRASLYKRGNMSSPGRYWLMIVSICEGRLRVLMGRSGQFDWRLWDTVLHLTYPSFAQFPLWKTAHLGSHLNLFPNQSLCHTISLSLYLSIYHHHRMVRMLWFGSCS